MFSGRFLKDGAIILVQPIKQSLKLEKFPKIAKVKWLYKKGSKADPSKSSSIQFLPLISFLYEKILKDFDNELLK